MSRKIDRYFVAFDSLFLPDREALVPVKNRVTTYVGAGIAAPARPRQREAAEQVKMERTEPADLALDEAIEHAVTNFSDSAERANLLATVGSLFVVAVAGIALMALLRRFGQTAAEAARTAGEQIALRRSEARFRALVQGAELIAIVQPDGLVTYCSPSVEQMLGLSADAVEGSLLSALVHPEDTVAFAQLLELVVSDAQQSHDATIRLRQRNGAWRHVDVVCRDARADESVGGLVLNARDVTERMSLESELAHRAYHDPDRVAQPRPAPRSSWATHLLRGARSGLSTAVLFIDLDNFKVINDSLGHQAGDRLLITVAQRLRAAVRPGDTAARLGGDEFTVLLEDLAMLHDAVNVAERFLQPVARIRLTWTGMHGHRRQHRHRRERRI